MYTAFFGLREKPFALAPDPRYLFLSASHKDALAHLIYGIEEGHGFIQVIGQVGTGKTTLCRTLLERIGGDAEIAYIFNPSPSEIELLAAINREFGLPVQARTRTELLDSLNHFLLEKNANGRRVLLVIDEAQNLDPDVLEQVRLLSNLETDRAKLLQIVLIGQPELEQSLARSDLRQLRQRITVRWSLRALSREELKDYVEHRLRVAGLDKPELFSSGALRALHRLSKGIPRLVNAIADRALLAGYARGEKTIDARTVRRAGSELPSTESGIWREVTGLRISVAAAILGLGALFGLVLTVLSPQPVEPVAAAIGAIDRTVSTEVSTARPAAPLPARVLEASPNASAAQALEALLSAWGYEKVIAGELDPDRFPEAVHGISPLLVLSTRITPESLALLDLAAVLELEPKPGERRYVALLGLGDDGLARLGLAREFVEVDRAELELRFTGRAFFLWANFEQLPALEPGMKGSAVRWLQARLIELGYLSAGDATQEYDDLTSQAVRRFQSASGLAPSGEVGPETLIALYQILDYTTPRLSPPEAAS